jgi:hypothetical protein
MYSLRWSVARDRHWSSPWWGSATFTGWNRRPLARTRWRPTAVRTASSVAMTPTRLPARVTAVYSSSLVRIGEAGSSARRRTGRPGERRAAGAEPAGPGSGRRPRSGPPTVTRRRPPWPRPRAPRCLHEGQCAAAAEQVEHAVAVPGADGLGEGTDGGAITMAHPQRHDAVVQLSVVLVVQVDQVVPHGRGQIRGRPRRRAVHQVAEHRAGFHRRQLVRVSHQDQSRRRADRLQQPRRHRQRDHRRLVDDDHVVGQMVPGVVPEPAPAVRPPAEQPVQRGRGQVRREPQLGGLLADRLLQAGRRLPGRRRQGDPGRRPPAARTTASGGERRCASCRCRGHR